MSATRPCPKASCSHPNPADAEFCAVCGAVLNAPLSGANQKRRGKQSIVREFLLFIKHEKKWWLIPLLILLLLIGGLVIFAGSSPLAPFLYPLF